MKFILSFIAFMLMATPSYAKTMVLLIDMSDSIDNNEANFQIDAYENVFQTLTGLQYFKYEIIEYGYNFQYSLSNASWNDALTYFQNWNRTQNGTTCMYNPLKTVLDNFSNYEQPVIIDITGDGVHNCTAINGHSIEDVYMVLDQLEALGAQINVLYIGQVSGIMTVQDDDKLFKLFEQMVRGGGFSLRAENYLTFEYALFEKLALEMSYLNSN